MIVFDHNSNTQRSDFLQVWALKEQELLFFR